jgi:hypothetical protein
MTPKQVYAAVTVEAGTRVVGTAFFRLRQSYLKELKLSFSSLRSYLARVWPDAAQGAGGGCGSRCRCGKVP